MSDIPRLKLPYLASVQAQTRVTVNPEAALPVFSGGAAMPESCRVRGKGDAQ